MSEKKEKQYVSDNAQLMTEWDWDKNNKLNIHPTLLSYGSHVTVWWKCANNHSWSSIVSNRARLNRGCPYCAGQLPIVGETDLATTNPNLTKEWNYEKNVDLLPQQFMSGSHKKVWWVCEKGHEWPAQIKSRTTGVGCPYCSNKKVLPGYNDLATTHPELAKEWHPTKNNALLPSEITYGSGKSVWWLCKNGHEFPNSVYNRTKGESCPVCSSRRRTSFPEQAIFYYVKQAFPDAINSYTALFDKGSMELDVYIPQLKTGIEYDGKAFHSQEHNRIRDARKYRICKEKGIMLIRITDNTKTEIMINCDHKITIPSQRDCHLEYAISQLLYKLQSPIAVNIKKDRNVILDYLSDTDYSLEKTFPELAKEWNYEQNGNLLPSMFHPGSNEKVWWKCLVCGKEWRTSLAERTGHDKTGCPICSRKKAAEKRKATTLKKRGSVTEKAPHLLAEWYYEKNDISPDSVSCTSNQKVWWQCATCGHKWLASIDKRIRGSGCPQCAINRYKKKK